MTASVLRYELKGKARARHDIFRLVLGPCAECCPCESSEQKLGQKPKSIPKEMKLFSFYVSSLNFSRKNKQLKKEGRTLK